MKMIKIKVADAPLKALDWLVAKAEGQEYSSTSSYNGIGMEFPATDYSTNWSLGGPIIGQTGLFPEPVLNEHCAVIGWISRNWRVDDEEYFGSTPLIAVMRCYTAWKFGPEIEVPEELLK